MKKLFCALMVAAVALMSSCGTPDEPGKGGGNNNDTFYGYEMNGVTVTNIGGDDYVFQMSYDIFDEETGKYLTSERFVSAYVTIPGVDEDNIFPEGTYSVDKGSESDNGYYVIGSWYQNNVSEAPYMMIVNNGQLEVKHTTDGYRLTVLVHGVNVETGKAINDIECRYEGDIDAIYGNTWTMANEGIAEWGGTVDGVSYWTLNLITVQGYMFDLSINTEAIDEEDIPNGIPSGKYVIDFGYEAGYADPFYYDAQTGSIYGSTLGILYENGAYQPAEGLVGGEINIENDGKGGYTVDINYYNNNFIPYTLHFQGSVEHSNGTIWNLGEYVNDATLSYLGGNAWNVSVGASELDMYFYLNFFTEEGLTFEDGIPSGTYTCNDTKEPNTILAGAIDEEGYYLGGSLFGNSTLSVLYDVLVSGTVTVTNNGNGAYMFDVALDGDATGVTNHYLGKFSGKPVIEDSSEPEAGEDDNTTTEPAAVKAMRSRMVDGLNQGKKVAFSNNGSPLAVRCMSINR